MYNRKSKREIATRFCSIALLLFILVSLAQAQAPQSTDHSGDAAGAQPDSNRGLSVEASGSRPIPANQRPYIDRGILKGFVNAWEISGGGANGREGVVLIFRMPDGSYLGEFQGYTNEYRKFTFRWKPAAIAIVHTHPNSSDPRPTEQDQRVADKFGVPNFTISINGMYVYDPATKTTTKVLDGLDWLDPSAYRRGLQAWLR